MKRNDIVLINIHWVTPIERFYILKQKENIEFLYWEISKKMFNSNVNDKSPIYFESIIIEEERFIKILLDTSGNHETMWDFIEIGFIKEDDINLLTPKKEDIDKLIDKWSDYIY